MIGLRSKGFGGRLAHRGVLFEQLMVFFHFPPSLVNRSQLRLPQIGVAADQIQHPLAAVLIGKDLSGHEHGFFDSLQIDPYGMGIGQRQRLCGLKIPPCTRSASLKATVQLLSRAKAE